MRPPDRFVLVGDVPDRSGEDPTGTNEVVIS
jgi:hypothetical protein